MSPETIEYRPSLGKIFGFLVGFFVAAALGVWVAIRPGASGFERLIGLATTGLFGFMALTVLYATLRYRAYLRLDERGVRMVDRFGRPRLDVPWSSVANAYEADAGRDVVVILVANDTPANLGAGLSVPTHLTGPDGESLGYGYIVNPAIVDVRPPNLIGEVLRRLEREPQDWDPIEIAQPPRRT